METNLVDVLFNEYDLIEYHRSLLECNNKTPPGEWKFTINAETYGLWEIEYKFDNSNLNSCWSWEEIKKGKSDLNVARLSLLPVSGSGE